MGEELVLFDIPGKQGRSWSPNVWKVRAVLNYMKIPYRTEWIEFPDIEPRMKELGIPPNPQGEFAPYTVPVVKFPNGTYVMESMAINKKIQELYPEPHVPLELGLLEEMTPINGKILGPLVPVIMPRVRRNVICEPSNDWFKKDRERRLGAPEEQYEHEKGGEAAWKAAEPGQEQLSEWLKSQKLDEGPFVLGSRVTYPDFVLAGRCEFAKLIGQDIYSRLVGPIDGLDDLYLACKTWMARNDH